MPTISFTPFGDWDRARIMVKAMPATIRRSMMYGQEKAVRKLAKIVKAHISSQDLSVFSQYPKKKISEHGSNRLLIDSATYWESINVWQSQYTFYVGVKAGLIEPNGNEIAKVASWLETGTRNIPARPVWGPSIEEMGGMQGINKIVYLVLLAKFKAQGWDMGKF